MSTLRCGYPFKTDKQLQSSQSSILFGCLQLSLTQVEKCQCPLTSSSGRLLALTSVPSCFMPEPNQNKQARLVRLVRYLLMFLYLLQALKCWKCKCVNTNVYSLLQRNQILIEQKRYYEKILWLSFFLKCLSAPKFHFYHQFTAG